MARIIEIGRIDGTAVHEVRLGSAGGIQALFLTYGARIAELWVPDRDGILADVVLGQDSLPDWQTRGAYLGATCGRYANRIAQGRFSLDGRAVQVDRNEGRNHLHGGAAGFDRRIWQIDGHADDHVTFSTLSPDGDMGYPGALAARVTYRLSGRGLEIAMTARTDAPTVVNLVNHAYFNLAGQGAGDVLGHRLQIEAGFYLPVDAELVPTGEVLPVAGTAFDFRTPRPIGAGLPGPGGFDHNLCLSSPPGPDRLRPCLTAADPVSGRQMRLMTTEPGIQIYTGAHFDGGPGKAGRSYGRFAGIAVETQRFPDSPNRPHFPSARLDPGETYCHLMRFDFSPMP